MRSLRSRYSEHRQLSGCERQKEAFSLIEVVLAIGILGVTLITVLALMTPLAREIREIEDRKRAMLTSTAVDLELSRLGYTYFVDTSNFQLRGDRRRINLVVRNDAGLASVVPVPTGLANALPPEEQYFLARVEVFPDDSELAFEEGDAHVALRVTMIWPFRDPGLPDRAFPGADVTDIQGWVDDNNLSSLSYNTAVVVGQDF